jgi:4'-phosphopantetheinyl transferase
VGRAAVWLARPGEQSGCSDRLGTLDTLDAVERRRLAALRDATTARAYAVLHLLARDVLAEVVGCRPGELLVDRSCPRCGEQHGPPRLVDHPGVHLSLSRTGHLVAVAVSVDAPVGVDVEVVAGTRFAGFDAVAVHPDERTADLDEHARAVGWVRKEAALKALGVGFVVDPADLRTPQAGRPGVVVPGHPAVTVVDLPLDGHSRVTPRAHSDGERDERDERIDGSGAGEHVAALALAAAYREVEVTVHDITPGG